MQKILPFADPVSVSAALSSTQRDQWKAAMMKEYSALLGNQTWATVSLFYGRKAIKNKLIFTITKRDNDGKIVRYKARLLAKGCLQKPGLNYNEVLASQFANWPILSSSPVLTWSM